MNIRNEAHANALMHAGADALNRASRQMESFCRPAPKRMPQRVASKHAAGILGMLESIRAASRFVGL